jgi:PadR family transcriptional regulator, regulatory protein AphA
LQKYEGIERYLRAGLADNPDCSYSLITVRYGILRCQALLTWCDETQATLQTMSDTQQ